MIIRRKEVIEAFQFEPDAGSFPFRDVCKYDGPHDNFPYGPPTWWFVPPIPPNSYSEKIMVGDWVVKDAEGLFRVMNEHWFHSEYEAALS